jgi:hypothetical protein
VQHAVAVAAVLAGELRQALAQLAIAVVAGLVALRLALMPTSRSAWRSLRPSSCNCRTTSRRAAKAFTFP